MFYVIHLERAQLVMKDTFGFSIANKFFSMDANALYIYHILYPCLNYKCCCCSVLYSKHLFPASNSPKGTDPDVLPHGQGDFAL